MTDMDRNRRLEDEGLENRLEGAGKDIKGRIKDAGGGLMGDSEMQAEGKWDRLKGKVQGKVGRIQERIGRERDHDRGV